MAVVAFAVTALLSTKKLLPADRLLLCSYDELCVLWDAIVRHKHLLADDPSDYYLELMVALEDRVGELLATQYDRLVNKKDDGDDD